MHSLLFSVFDHLTLQMPRVPWWQRSLKMTPFRSARDSGGALVWIQSRAWVSSPAASQLNYLGPVTCYVTYIMGGHACLTSGT